MYYLVLFCFVLSHLIMLQGVVEVCTMMPKEKS